MANPFDITIPGAPRPDYDEDAYFRKYGKHPNYAQGEHGSDEFKTPDHITFSDESAYSTPENPGGKWIQGKDGKWTFQASKANLESHSPEELKRYFASKEKGIKLILPEHQKLVDDYILGLDSDTVQGMAAPKKKMWGNQQPVDTRTFQQYDPNAQKAQKDLQPGFDLMNEFVSGMADMALTPTMAVMGDPASQADMKSRVIPDPNKEYLGMIPMGVKSAAETKPFYSAVEKAIDGLEGNKVKAASLVNRLLKVPGVTKAEINALGLDKITGEVTKYELKNIIGSKGVKLGEDVYGVNKKDSLKSKDPKYSQYKAIKSQEGVVPDSYTEEFVTAEFPEPLDIAAKEQFGVPFNQLTRDQVNKLDAPFGKAWSDQHGGYEDTKNPMIRLRYDVQELPDGKKVMRIHEIQDPHEVQEARSTPEERAKQQYMNSFSYKKDFTPWEKVPDEVKQSWIKAVPSNPVPQELASRAMDLGVKKALARAKEMGLDGISWATGEQTRDLYNNALCQVADEARYNPDTQELHILKNGSPVQGYPKVVKPEVIPDHIGKDAAHKLLESDTNITKPPSRKDWKFGTDDDSDCPDWKYKDYQIIDFTEMRGQTAGYELYQGYQKLGEFNSLESAKRHASKVIQDTDEFDKKKIGSYGMHRLTDLSMDAQWPGRLYGDFEKTGETVQPKLEFADYGNGIWSTEDGKFYIEEKDGDYEVIYAEREEDMPKSIGQTTSLERAKEIAQHHEGNTAPKLGSEFNFKAQVPSLLGKYGKGKFGELGPESIEDTTTPKQPVMWLTDKTPSSFPIYEGVTGVFKMLQEEVSKAGGGARGTLKVATKFGLPAGLIAKFLSASDKEKKKMYPQLKGVLNASQD